MLYSKHTYSYPLAVGLCIVYVYVHIVCKLEPIYSNADNTEVENKNPWLIFNVAPTHKHNNVAGKRAKFHISTAKV